MTGGSFPANMINNGRKYHFNTITRMLLPGILFFTIAACKNDPDQIRALTGQGNKQEDRAEDVTVIYSKEGKLKMRLFAHQFVRNEYAKPPYIDMNRNLKVEFYNDSGAVENILTADSSRYYIAQGNVLVWDSVQIVSKKGERLNTSELIWNESIQKFFTEKPVTITTPTEVLYGNGMEANSDFTWYQITNPKGTVQVNKGEVPQ
jgi:LPS export ABC transporter protein LptC